MAATIIDSRIFGDMFSDARMREVWSDENRTAKYLDIERALAKVQGELGIIPQEAADEIVKNCELSMIDWDKLKAKTEQIGYPIIAVVNQINANCRDRLGEYCHWGATTQDITDTAVVLQMRERFVQRRDDGASGLELELALEGPYQVEQAPGLRFRVEVVDAYQRHLHRHLTKHGTPLTVRSQLNRGVSDERCNWSGRFIVV